MTLKVVIASKMLHHHSSPLPSPPPLLLHHETVYQWQWLTIQGWQYLKGEASQMVVNHRVKQILPWRVPSKRGYAAPLWGSALILHPPAIRGPSEEPGTACGGWVSRPFPSSVC